MMHVFTIRSGANRLMQTLCGSTGIPVDLGNPFNPVCRSCLRLAREDASAKPDAHHASANLLPSGKRDRDARCAGEGVGHV